MYKISHINKTVIDSATIGKFIKVAIQNHYTHFD